MQVRAPRLGGTAVLAIAVLAGPVPLSASGAPRGPISTERIAGRTMQVSRHAHSFRREGALPAPSARNGFRHRQGTATARLAALPARWCGSERSTDDRRHAASEAPQVKVVYAHPHGAPNRFAAYRDLIQQDVATARELVASASGGRRTIRFDMGTDCAGGSRYVDIQSVALPHPANYYGFDPAFASRLLASDLRPLLRSRGARNVTTYVDGVTPGSATGIASQPLDETRGAANDANRGGQRAFVFGDGSPQFAFNRTRAFVHETTHNLGAVQDAAPHATGAGHCFDGEDVMCYDDGGRTAASIDPMSPCPGPARFDCGANDYFAVAPKRRSYLARHWNLFDSKFMCAVSSCGASGGGATSSGAIHSALRVALRALIRQLRARGLPALTQGRVLRTGFIAPGPGRLRLDLTTGAGRLAGGSRTFRRGGPGIVRASFGPGRRRLVGASRVRVAVRLSFVRAGEQTRHSKLLVLRKK